MPTTMVDASRPEPGTPRPDRSAVPLARRVIAAILGLALRIFFRRIRFAGLEHVDPEGPVIFVLNHPNGLIDPGLLLCHAPRRVSFLAKSTLFSMPIVGFLTRSFDSLPVFRQQDQGSDPRQNRATFDAARDLLLRGGALALFPEGTSHSDPKLKPLKTGAARIALGAATALDEARPGTVLRIVPAGLYYTDKRTFRSEVLVAFGPPLEVPRVALDASGEPPREEAKALTDRIARALSEVTLEADRGEALELAARAERILTVAGGSDAKDLARQLEVRKRLAAGYAYLRRERPEELDALAMRVLRYESERIALGLPADAPSPDAFTIENVTVFALRHTGVIALLSPLALLGLVTHYPAYELVDVIARRGARSEEDVVSTFKFLSALLLFPLTWLLLAGVAGRTLGWPAALVTLVALPLAGLSAQLVAERLAVLVGGARALGLFATRKRSLAWLSEERAAIREAILALGERIPEDALRP